MKIRSLLLGSVALSGLTSSACLADIGIVNCAIPLDHGFSGGDFDLGNTGGSSIRREPVDDPRPGAIYTPGTHEFNDMLENTVAGALGLHDPGGTEVSPKPGGTSTVIG